MLIDSWRWTKWIDGTSPVCFCQSTLLTLVLCCTSVEKILSKTPSNNWQDRMWWTWRSRWRSQLRCVSKLWSVLSTSLDFYASTTVTMMLGLFIHLSVHLCACVFLNMLFPKSFEGISPNTQFWCTWDRDELIRFEVKRSKFHVMTRPNMAQQAKA